MRLGLWGARADNSGLGQQTFEFYRHMKPHRTAVVDISVLERDPKRVMKQYPERYANDDGVKFIYGIPSQTDMIAFLSEVDVVFIAESAYNNDFYRLARQMNVKVTNQYNYEFFDWFIYPQFMLPDVFIAPSKWNYDHVEQFCVSKGIGHTYLHCPVNRQQIKKRFIDEAKLFVHIAGRPAAHDRNGTELFLEAIERAQGLLKGIVYTQSEELSERIRTNYKHTRAKLNVENYKDMYKSGEVLVMPRRYGGNCLPVNEALAAGMPVIMPDISPNNELLPQHWLVAATESAVEFAPRIRIPVFDADINALTIKMLWFKSLSEDDMKAENQTADEIAQSISWEVMQPKYKELFESLCRQSPSSVLSHA